MNLIKSFRDNRYLLKQKFLGYPRLKKMFKQRVGYDLNLTNPKTFNEIMNWRKIYCRKPSITLTADKYKVREYLIEQLGEEYANNIIVPKLLVTDKPSNIDYNLLPDEFIVKANHGSGTNKIVDKKKDDLFEVLELCEIWLETDYGFLKHEWAYQNIEKKIIIEKLMKDDSNELPIDYKFNMVNGECYFIEVYSDRFGKGKQSIYDPDWNQMDVIWSPEIWEKGTGLEKPKKFNEMLNLAERLSEEFLYVRVDLYAINDSVYFGELTHYPASGMGAFLPQSFDYSFGKKILESL